MRDTPDLTEHRTQGWPRPGWAWVSGALVVLATSTVLVLRTGLRPGEEALFSSLNDQPRVVGLPLQVVMPLGASVGALVLVGLALVLRRNRLAVAAFLAWALGRTASAAMKAVIDRPRPTELLAEVDLRQAQPFDAAFPSAHTTGAVALAVVAGWAFPRWRLPALGLAVLVALARLYVGVHLPLDLVGGAALGLLAGVAATAAVDRWWPVPAGLPAAGPVPPATEGDERQEGERSGPTT